MKLSFQQFESIMAKQDGKCVILSVCGTFDHSNIYKEFRMESDESEYHFLELTIKSPDEEYMVDILLKRHIGHITYLDFSNQIELILCDGSRVLFELINMIEIEEL